MNTEHFKNKLTEELSLVEKELREIAVLNESTQEWEAKRGDIDTTTPMADPNESADGLEQYEEHREEVPALAARWSDIKHALGKIEDGTYGACEVSGEPIEEDRLEANPAARTCKKHM